MTFGAENTDSGKTHETRPRKKNRGKKNVFVKKNFQKVAGVEESTPATLVSSGLIENLIKL